MKSNTTQVIVADPTALDPQRLLGLLDAHELARYERYRFEHSKREHAIAHGLLRLALGRATGASPTEFRFAPGPHGKPEIAHPPLPQRLDFNLSHTRGLVACALAWRRTLGVDVERIDRATDIDALARRYFAPSETQELQRLDGEARQRRFFQLWTLKEAYLKARGAGLSLPLRSAVLSFDPEPSLAFAPGLDDDPARWQLHQEQRGRHLLAVVAGAGTSFEVGDGTELLSSWRPPTQ